MILEVDVTRTLSCPERAMTKATLLVALSLSLCGCRAGESTDLLSFTGPTMGTTWIVKAAIEPEARGDGTRLDSDIRDLLTRINVLVSTWDPESELSRFNRSASLEPFPVAPETFDLFRWAVTLARETDGALDVTVGRLVDAWGFGSGETPPSPPDEETVARLLDDTGVDHLELDPDGQWIRKRRPDLRCDFSAFAPGFAADRIAALLEQRGFGSFLIDVGGELVARGRNQTGLPWQVAIERPQKERRAVARLVPLTNAAIATSGDYRNYREVEGERVTHILDPATGRPIRHHLASVTVIDALGVRADGLATALMVLGPEHGMALAERLGLAALLIVRKEAGDFEQRASSAFAALTEEQS